MRSGPCTSVARLLCSHLTRPQDAASLSLDWSNQVKTPTATDCRWVKGLTTYESNKGCCRSPYRLHSPDSRFLLRLNCLRVFILLIFTGMHPAEQQHTPARGLSIRTCCLSRTSPKNRIDAPGRRRERPMCEQFFLRQFYPPPMRSLDIRVHCSCHWNFTAGLG